MQDYLCSGSKQQFLQCVGGPRKIQPSQKEVKIWDAFLAWQAHAVCNWECAEGLQRSCAGPAGSEGCWAQLQGCAECPGDVPWPGPRRARWRCGRHHCCRGHEVQAPPQVSSLPGEVLRQSSNALRGTNSCDSMVTLYQIDSASYIMQSRYITIYNRTMPPI